MATSGTSMAEKGEVAGKEVGLVVLMVGAGGLLGAVLRYLVATWVQGVFGGGGFPYGTLAVNAAGCLVIGLVAGYAEARQPLGAQAQAFLVIGVLGGFTTFSAFGIDTVRLLRDGAYLAGAANVFLQVAVGLAAVAAGLRLAQWCYERLASGP